MSALPEDFYKQLYEKAQWLYSSERDATLDDYYTFDSYWMDPPLSVKKRGSIKDETNTRPIKSLMNESKTFPSKEPAQQARRTAVNLHNNPFPELNATPLRNPGIDIAALNSITKAIKEDGILNTLSAPPKLNLVPTHQCSAHFSAWKHSKGINAEVHRILNPSLCPSSFYHDCQLNAVPEPMTPLSYAHLASTIDASSNPCSPAISNKEDILTQSQMLKTFDKNEFMYPKRLK